MLKANRRSTLKLLGGATLAAAALPRPAAAQAEDLVVPNSLQHFKRGTIHSMHPEARSFTIIWEDLGRVKMKAADLVRNFPDPKVGKIVDVPQLKVGQIVDVHWYDYMDFLIAKTTPAVTARAKAMLAQGARLEGIPGAQERIRLWQMAGLCTKIDMASNSVFLINASGGEPDKPAPDSGEVIQMPQIITAPGKAALRTLQPGDQITTVFSQQTAIKATIIR
jgi:Cu/Ag efflux protein CusF